MRRYDTMARKITLLLILITVISAFLLASCSRKSIPPDYNPPSGTPTSPAASPSASNPLVVPETPAPTPSKSGGQNQNTQQAEKGDLSKAPKVEVVFVLDTTGSMAGLIKGAQQKIWSIANAIISAQPKPLIKFGLIGYRDRGDDYVTKVYGLSDNIDKVYENLMAFNANGGGDTPESVNKALYDALHGMQWTQSRNALRIIFLVGDAPPHMDYQENYTYKSLCAEARQRDIIINTIQCGDDSDTERYWKEICSLSSGKFASIDQSGGVVATVDTPMDKDLAALNSELGKTLVPYGGERERGDLMAYQHKSEAMAPAVQAERAKFNAGSLSVSKSDLVDAVKNKEVKLDDIGAAELPAELQTMDKSKREAYILDQGKKRDDLKKKISDISKKRDEYIQKQTSQNKDSFDNQVLSFIKEQARSKGMTIK